jgi:hypothetical protein
VRIILDGLDEYDQKDHRQILDSILPLSSWDGSGSTCKVLISGREVPQINRILMKKPTVSLNDERESVHKAIQRYVHHHMTELRQELDDIIVDDNTIFTTENRIVDKSDGEHPLSPQMCHQSITTPVRHVFMGAPYSHYAGRCTHSERASRCD